MHLATLDDIKPTSNYLISSTDIVISGTTVLKLFGLLKERPDIAKLLWLSIEPTDKELNEQNFFNVVNYYTQDKRG